MPKPRRRSLAAVLVALLLAAGAGGCGDDMEQGEPREGNASGGNLMPAADVARVLEAQRQLAASCREASGRRGALASGLATLATVYRENPDQLFTFGNSTRIPQPMRQIVEENRDRLARCGEERAAGRLDRLLDG